MWRVIASDREGREIARKEIDVGEITLGRDGDRMLVLQSPSVSRRHCRLRADPTGLSITDDGSANGVLINGTRISPNTPTAINASMRVEIAEFRLTVEQFGMPAPPPMPGQMMPGQMMPGQMMQGQMPGQMPGMMAPAAMSNVVPPHMQGQMPGMMAPGQQPMGMMPMAGMSGVVPGAAPGQMGGAGPGDMVRLIAEGGQYSGRVFDLPQLGEITVGRNYTAAVIKQADTLSATPSGINTGMGVTLLSQGISNDFWNSNQIRYDSPSFGPVSFSAHGALGEGVVGHNVGGNLRYDQGPLAVSLSHQVDKDIAGKSVKWTMLFVSTEPCSRPRNAQRPRQSPRPPGPRRPRRRSRKKTISGSKRA